MAFDTLEREGAQARDGMRLGALTPLCDTLPVCDLLYPKLSYLRLWELSLEYQVDHPMSHCHSGN